eukprot:s79_g8.t1
MALLGDVWGGYAFRTRFLVVLIWIWFGQLVSPGPHPGHLRPGALRSAVTLHLQTAGARADGLQVPARHDIAMFDPPLHHTDVGLASDALGGFGEKQLAGLKMLRFVLVGAGALFVSVVQGVLAAVPICLFAGFLFAAPNASYQKRGFNALCCLSMSFLMADAFMFLAGVSFSAEEEKNVTIAQGCLAVGHLWLLFAALLVLFYTEIVRQQNLQAHEAFLVEVEMTEGNTPDSTPGRRSLRGSVGIAFQLQDSDDVGLTVRSSKKAVLKDISLEIAADTSCALMGPSGSGKSSLLNVLTGRALHYGAVSGTITANNEAIPEGLESNLKTKNASGFATRLEDSQESPTLGQDGANLGQDGANLGQDGASLGQDGANLGQDGAILGPDGGNLGQDGASMGQDGANLGQDGANLGQDGANLGPDGANLGHDGANLGQDGELTVYENVYFSARLRLPPNTGLVETAARVEKVLKDVGISHVKDTVVGAMASRMG